MTPHSYGPRRALVKENFLEFPNRESLSTNAGNPMGFLPRIWENDGTIFSQVGKYFNMLFPILGNARDKKSPPWERVG